MVAPSARGDRSGRVRERSLHRERIGRPTGPVELGRLPALDKATMMEHFDELVTDPRLSRDELLAHVEALTGDGLHLGRYRAMTTSGSSGRKGLFVYDRPAWRALIGQFLRYSAMVGIRPRLPRRLRVAALGGVSGSHMTRRVAQSVDVGLHRVLSLPVTLPLTQLTGSLTASSRSSSTPTRPSRSCWPRSSSRAACGSVPKRCRPVASCARR